MVAVWGVACERASCSSFALVMRPRIRMIEGGMSPIDQVAGVIRHEVGRGQSSLGS